MYETDIAITHVFRATNLCRGERTNSNDQETKRHVGRGHLGTQATDKFLLYVQRRGYRVDIRHHAE